MAWEETLLIVALEYAEGIDHSPKFIMLEKDYNGCSIGGAVKSLPRIEEQKKSSCNLEPGDKSSIRWCGKSHWLFWCPFRSFIRLSPSFRY